MYIKKLKPSCKSVITSIFNSQESSQEDMERWKLVRVDEKFRVIALGLPIPKYAGHPLDPPLRSRFQALDIGPKTFKDQLHLMQTSATSVREDLTLQLASFAYAVNAPESKAQGLPDFPIDNLPVAAKLMVNENYNFLFNFSLY